MVPFSATQRRLCERRKTFLAVDNVLGLRHSSIVTPISKCLCQTWHYRSICCCGTDRWRDWRCYRYHRSFQSPYNRNAYRQAAGLNKEKTVEQLTRRDFGKFSAKCALLLSVCWSTILTGCASFQTILNWVKTGLD